MPAATITILEETDASVSFSGAGWTTDSSSSHSGGTAKKTTGNGDTCTFVAPANCRAIYLFHAVVQGGSLFSVTVDGVPQAGQFSCATAGAVGSGGYYRYLTPLYRGAVDAPHTVVLSNPACGTTLFVDAFVTVSGPKGTPLPGVYVAMGDSWTVGSGAVNTRTAYLPRAAALLQQKLRRPITPVNQGLAGDFLFASAGKAGGVYRTIAALANQPEFLSYLFGANDLSTSSQPVPAGEFARTYHALLCLLEDALDTSQVKVAVSTPPWLSPGVLWNNFAPVNSWGSPLDNLESAAALVRHVVAQFPWCLLADVFGAMDYRTGLLVPNSNNDLGLHPNDMGHGVIAMEMARALLDVVG